MRASPVVVAGPEMGGIPELREAGFCVYDLQRMHDEHARGETGVMEVDFYRALGLGLGSGSGLANPNP
jgi:hypothetical protein